MKDPDFVKRAITKHLKPALADAGFYRIRPRKFVRLRGDLVDVIAFQMSQWGGRDFFVHHFCNLLPMPEWEDPLEGYKLGERISNGTIDWCGETADKAEAAILDVVQASDEVILPWFDHIAGIKDYIVEYIAKPSTVLSSMQIVVALLLLGKTNRPYWALQEMIEVQPDEFDDPVEFASRNEFYRRFQEQVDSRQHINLLNEWRTYWMEKHQLTKAMLT